MRKQLSFKKVVEATDEATRNLWKIGMSREEVNKMVRIYAPYYLDFIFNKITNYPKSIETIEKELRNRMGATEEQCLHCGSPKKAIAGLARDTRGKIIRCPFHNG